MLETQGTDRRLEVVGVPITAVPACEQLQRMIEWAEQRESRFVCVANVHMVMEARWDPRFNEILQSSDIVAPDGMPLVWMLRWLGAWGQDRLPGLDIFVGVCKEAEHRGIKIFLYGSTSEILQTIESRLRDEYPSLQIAGAISPPFRDLDTQEQLEFTDRINESGAGIIFVALGCPKQERWMFERRGLVKGVMIGVGGAFPVYAGLQKRAPKVVRRLGLEWLFRLAQEPQRLWRRYWSTNLPFISLAIKQILRGR